MKLTCLGTGSKQGNCYLLENNGEILILDCRMEDQMQITVDFHISIPCDKNKPDTITWLKEKSCYNHNYYRIGDYGDWLFGKLDTILQICHEDENCYEYQYGYFENDKFIPMLYWNITEDIFEELCL